MSESLKVAACQMNSVDSVEKNLEQMLSLIEDVPTKTNITFFPENCLYMRIKEGDSVHIFDLSEAVFMKLAQKANQKKMWLHLGSLPVKMAGVTYNSSVMISPSGEVFSSYQKIHLFDISLEGRPPVKESDVFTHGEAPRIIEVEEWKIGQTICYDVRFSELFTYYAQNHVDMLIVPSAFLVETGKVHWDILLRARAIESQAFLVAAAQAGTHVGINGGSRGTYGHSLIVDPWGNKLQEAKSDGPEVISFELRKAEIRKVREQIPMRSHRRLVKVRE